MKKYIVCDVCYIVSDEKYDKQIMPLWFPDSTWQIHEIEDIDTIDIYGNPLHLIRTMSTNFWDCVVEWLGCDAWNFSLFSSDTFDVRDNKWMFRVFDSEDEAREFQERIISNS